MTNGLCGAALGILICLTSLNALNLIFCKFHIAQIIIIEYIDNLIKGALEVVSSVCSLLFAPFAQLFKK